MIQNDETNGLLDQEIDLRTLPRIAPVYQVCGLRYRTNLIINKTLVPTQGILPFAPQGCDIRCCSGVQLWVDHFGPV